MHSCALVCMRSSGALQVHEGRHETPEKTQPRGEEGTGAERRVGPQRADTGAHAHARTQVCGVCTRVFKLPIQTQAHGQCPHTQPHTPPSEQERIQMGTLVDAFTQRPWPHAHIHTLCLHTLRHRHGTTHQHVIDSSCSHDGMVLNVALGRWRFTAEAKPRMSVQHVLSPCAREKEHVTSELVNATWLGDEDNKRVQEPPSAL
jgi:hypothetical protein